MKILLINPKPKVWSAPRVPPLGLAYIAAVLEDAGHSVQIWDSAVDKREPDFRGFRMVGATATTSQIGEAWRILALAKKTGALTFLGGPHVSSLPKESLAKPCVDYVVRREGEETVVELAAAVAACGSVAGIRGLSHKAIAGAEPVCEADRDQIADLDSLPFPAYHLLPKLGRYGNPQPLLSRRSPAAPIFTSRGCPYGCPFCYKGVFGRTWRARSPENVVAEWEFLVRQLKVKEIAVQDDVFNLDVPRAIRICRLVRERGVTVPWSTPNGLRADCVSEELFSAMRESGCERVAFGVESGSQRMLDSMEKGLTLEQIENAFRLARKAGLATMAFFMFGNLGETRVTVEETIRFAIRLNPDWAQFTVAAPYPGTRLYEIVRSDGRLLVGDWAQYGHYTRKAFFEMGQVGEMLVLNAMKDAYRRFYLRPSYILRQLGRAGTWANMGAGLRGAWHLLGGA